MIQTGDPSGTGKGGESIWGTPFEDEVRSTLKVGFLTDYTFAERGLMQMIRSSMREA